jgi:hypothetical protein
MINAFFKRDPNSIEGLFTLQENGEPIFKRLRARSGQAGFTKTNWNRGKSPIPFGNYLLWLDSPLDIGKRAGAKGIGEFYNISSTTDNRRIIANPGGIEKRWDIGLHAENSYPGSAGCIVLVDVDHAYEKVFPYLRQLGKRVQTIELRVI